MDNFSFKINDLIEELFLNIESKDYLKYLFFSTINIITPIWDKYKILPNIKEHSEIVGVISLYLLYNLKDDNKYFKILKNYLMHNSLTKIEQLLLSSALLHDIGKTIELNDKNRRSHAEIGYNLLLSEGRIVEAIACQYHLIDSFVNKKLPLIPFIVNLADKHVMHQNIVTIKNRFNDLRKRYPEFLSLFNDKVIEVYENSCIFFHTEQLRKVIDFYNI